MDKEQKVVTSSGEETAVDWEKHSPGMSQAEKDEWESDVREKRSAAKANEQGRFDEVKVHWTPRHRPGMNQAEEDEWEARGGAPHEPPVAD